MNIFEYMSIKEDEKPLDRIVTDGGFVGIFRKIACVGDSLSSGEFESWLEGDKRGWHDLFEYSWGQYIARSTGSTVYNFSRGGMTAQEYVESFADNNRFWASDKAAHAYIIALAVNDVVHNDKPIGSVADICKEDYTKNAHNYLGYYAMIIQRYKQIQPRAKFFLVAPPRHGNEQDARRKEVRDALASLCQFFNNTYLIDLYSYAPVYDAEFDKAFTLGHMTPMGYVLSARMIESYIDYIIRKNPEDFNQVGFIGTDLYYKKKDF